MGRSSFPDLTLACKWVGPIPDTAGCGAWGVPKLMLTHWWMLGLDPGWLVEWPNMSGAGIACHGRNWSQSTCLLGGQSLVPGSLTAPWGSPKAGVRPKVVRVGFWGHWLRGPRCSRDCVGLLVGRIWGLRAPDAYLLAGGLGPNRAVCGTPDVLRSGSACCCVEPHPGASVCTAQGTQSWFWPGGVEGWWSGHPEASAV